MPLPLLRQLHDVARARPMAATATTMVKSIWQAYFKPAAQEEAEEGAEGPAAEQAKVGGEGRLGCRRFRKAVFCLSRLTW